MRIFLDFVVDLFENVFFFGLLDNIAISIPLEVKTIPDPEIDPECPIHYRLTMFLGASTQTASA